MRLASFNVENLFDRAKAMNLQTWAEGKPILEAFSAFNAVLNQAVYTNEDKARILDFVARLGLSDSDVGEYVILRQNRGRLLTRPTSGPVEVAAAGRADWVGWLELRRQAVDDTAVSMTGRVINDLSADVLALVEVESRDAILHLNDQVLVQAGGPGYGRAMVIDGNDDRGINVGILATGAYELRDMRSHVDDVDAGGRKIFSRDCPEYLVRTPTKKRLWVLANHLKSKGYGPQPVSNALRAKQAARVRELVDALLAAGEKHVAVVGDFNDTPASEPLAPLLGAGSPLKDISAHPAFSDGGRPGTYGNCAASNKIDYILLSPALFARVQAGGIFRKGAWGGVNGTLWEHYPELTGKEHAASDHCPIWADINL